MTDLSLFDFAPASRNPATVYIASLVSKHSRRAIQSDLNAIASLTSTGVYDAFTFPWHQLEYQHCAVIRSRLSEKYAPATANRMMSSLKGVLKECKRLGLMKVEDYDKAVDLKPIRGSRPIRGRALSAEEIQSLFDACANDRSNRGVRDGAVLSVLRVGLRRSEVVALDATDIDNTGAVSIRHGKGDKARTVYLPKRYLPLMDYWLELRGKAELDTNALFLGVSKSDRILTNRLTDQAVLVVLRARAEQARIKESFSAHDWRRTAISDLLDAGVDIATVAKIAGHSSVTQSEKYDRRGDKVKREAIDLLGI